MYQPKSDIPIQHQSNRMVHVELELEESAKILGVRLDAERSELDDRYSYLRRVHRPTELSSIEDRRYYVSIVNAYKYMVKYKKPCVDWGFAR